MNGATSSKERLEADIRELTSPLNNQYPRPWMTTLSDPSRAKVFVVGHNQKNGYSVDAVGSQERHIDALFNRNGETCRGLYDEVTGGAASATRKNTDALVRKLREAGVCETLETNVICYSTDMSAHLSQPIHLGGSQRGDKLFRFLLATIRPSVLIAHGGATREALEKTLGRSLPSPPKTSSEEIVKVRLEGADYNPTVYTVQSLAPPAVNQGGWVRWMVGYFDRLAVDVAKELKGGREGPAGAPSSL